MTRRDTTWTILVLLGAGAAVAACQGPAKSETARGPASAASPAAAVAPSAESPAPAATTYSLTVGKAEVRAGEKGEAVVSVTAAKGYKWNKEYPAKLTLTPGSRVKLDKAEFKQLGGDFEATDARADVRVPVRADAAGEETIRGEIKFSVCNDKTCLIEKAPVEIAVVVQP